MDSDKKIIFLKPDAALYIPPNDELHTFFKVQHKRDAWF